jgi:hypothetical protein
MTKKSNASSSSLSDLLGRTRNPIPPEPGEAAPQHDPSANNRPALRPAKPITDSDSAAAT